MTTPNLNNRTRAQLAFTIQQAASLLLHDAATKPAMASAEDAERRGCIISALDVMIRTADDMLQLVGGLDADDPATQHRLLAYQGQAIIVPNWANHLATDGDGEIWVYATMPEYCNCEKPRCPGVWNGRGKARRVGTIDRPFTRQDAQDSYLFVGAQ